MPEEAFVVADPGARPVAEEACEGRNPLRDAWFGDLHVHTSLSSDAWMFDLRLMPEDAYRYAFGETILLPPNDRSGRGTRPVRIDRPLDFAAVTDHAEFLGEGLLCQQPDAEGYDSGFCEMFRAGEGRAPRLVMQIFSPITWRNDAVCGSDGARCRSAARTNWEKTIAAAEAWNDRTSRCARTTFVAYEYSSMRMGSNLHRNVIFRNEVVPNLPVSYFDADREWKLWELLEKGCTRSGTGCDALAIPHNSNISNGRMFAVDPPGARDTGEQAARAAQRMRMEPIVEVMQHKGDSECRNGIAGVIDSEDELCDFERFEDMAIGRFYDPGEPFDDCSEGGFADWIPHLGPDCLSRLSYARYALIEGLRQEARIGVNPFKFGIIAATDTHNAMAGGVEERSYPGHLGRGDSTAEMRVSVDREVPGNVNNNPGGLTGVWAEENDRGALFDAMRRKEVFGTSGPRIKPRFFGGWALGADACDSPDWVEYAYASGVPMGGDLPRRPGDVAPTFLVAALADAGTRAAPGNDLQRIQIIKGWVDDSGVSHQAVHDVAGTPDNGASVDASTCEPRGPGHRQLCTVWTDPDFDPARRAVYYARAVENPSCRYNAWQCLALRGDARPADCDDPSVPRTIQERAWTSPIWYTPDS